VRVVVGTLAKDRAWVLPTWFQALHQTTVSIDVVCVVSPSSDQTEAICRNSGAEVLVDERPGRSTYDIEAHAWGSLETYAYMADLRNRLLEHVIAKGADVFFSLDTDIILGSNAIEQLLSNLQLVGGMISPAVNMAERGTAWNIMHWDLAGTPHRRAAVPSHLVPADVIMGAIMMDRSAFVCRWGPHSHGEDIGLCKSAEVHGVPRWWLPQLHLYHAMRRVTPNLTVAH